MQRALHYDVVIAGGGFVGRTLALALSSGAPSGFRIALVDAEPPASGAPKDARASALSAGTKNLLSVLGVWPALGDAAQAIEQIEITDTKLDAALRPHLLDFDTELKPGVQAYMVENRDLHHALATAVAAGDAIDIFAPERVTSYRVDDFRAIVTLVNGNEIAAPLLVAADGKRSQLREQAGIKCLGWSYPQIGIVATIAHAKPHGGKAVQHFLPAGPFAILPLKGDRSSIVWTEQAELGHALMQAPDAEFNAELVKRFGHRLGEISVVGPRQAFPLDMQLARSFVGSRLALIGDAAHAVHPLAGQGLNIGMRDVAALAQVVIESWRLGLDLGFATVLTRYERWRRFDSVFSATMMDGLNRLFSNDSAPLRALRDLGLGLVERAPALKRFLAREAAGATGDVPRLLRGESL